MTAKPKAGATQWLLRALAGLLLAAWAWWDLGSLLGFVGAWVLGHHLVTQQLRDAYMQLGVPRDPAIAAADKLLRGDPRALVVHVHHPHPRPTTEAQTNPPPATARGGVH